MNWLCGLGLHRWHTVESFGLAYLRHRQCCSRCHRERVVDVI